MGQHSRFCYAMAKKLQDMTDKGVDDLNEYQPLLARLEVANQWYAFRKPAAQGLIRPYKPSKPAAKATTPATPAAPTGPL